MNVFHINIKSEIYFRIFFEDFIYLFVESGEEKEKGRETSVCGCLLHALFWGPGLQPRHVP